MSTARETVAMTAASTISLSLSPSQVVQLERARDVYESRRGALGLRGLMSGLHFLNDGLQSGLLLIATLTAASIGVTRAEIGVLTSAHFFMSVLLALPAGLIARRFGGRAVLLAGMACSALSFCALSLTAGFWTLGAVLLFASLGFGSFHPVAFSTLAKSAAGDDTGRTMSNFTICGDIGRNVIGTALIALLAIAAWQMISVAAGLLTLLATVGLAVISTNDRGDNAADSESQGAKNPWHAGILRLITGNRPFVFVSVLGFLDALACSSLFVFLPLLMVDKGMSTAEVALLMGVYFWSALFGKVVIGRIADRFGSVRTLVVCLGVLAASLVGICGANGLWQHGILLAVMGTLTKGMRPIFLSLTANTLDKDSMDVGFGVNQTFVAVALTLSPLCLGVMSGTRGPANAVTAAAVVTAVTCLLAMFTPQNEPAAQPAVEAPAAETQSIFEENSIYDW